MIRSCSLILAANFLLALSAPAQTITYQFGGIITDNLGARGGSSVWDAVQVGDPFTITCEVDGFTPAEPLFAGRVSYNQSVRSIGVDVNGITAQPAVLSSSIVVSDDSPSLSNCNDGLEYSVPVSGGEVSNLFFGLSVNDVWPSCPTALDSADLPLALDITDFPIAFLSMAAGNSLIQGDITGVSISVVVDNDDCVNATSVGLGEHGLNTIIATTDGQPLDPGVCDMGAFGDEQIYKDVWFCFTAPSTSGYSISTSGLAGFDTRMAVYDNGCTSDDPMTVVACNDDESLFIPFEAGLLLAANAGTSYKIRIGGFGDDHFGAGAFRITEYKEPISFCFGDGNGRLCKCGNNDTLNPGTGGCLNSNGTGAVLTTNGILGVGANWLGFDVEGGTPTALAVLTSGDNALGGGLGILGTPDSDGLRCVGGNMRRHGSRSLDAMGAATFGPLRANVAASIISRAGFVAGQTRNFQVRYREDPVPGPCGFGTNTSQAIEITFEP